MFSVSTDIRQTLWPTCHHSDNDIKSYKQIETKLETESADKNHLDLNANYIKYALILYNWLQYRQATYYWVEIDYCKRHPSKDTNSFLYKHVTMQQYFIINSKWRNILSSHYLLYYSVIWIAATVDE